MGDFERGVAKGTALADKLDGKEVDIKVKASTAAAQAKLAATRAEMDRLDQYNLKVAKSGEEAGRGMGALVTAVLLLGPALVPLLAGAAGLAVGFGAMGAAGVLAVVGIVQEMKKGTPLGLAYTGMLQTLKSDLTTLGHTAASGTLAPFQQSVADLQQRMPVLNSIVGEFSVITGKTAGVLTTGLVAAFIALEPLARDAGVYILNLSQRFAAMMSGPGVVSFGDYVRSVFPQVMQAVESIVGAVFHLVAAIAPLGTGSLGILRLFADLLNTIPTEHLAVLVQLASSVYIGVMAFKMLDVPIHGVGVALRFAGTSALFAADAMRVLTIAAGVIGAIITVATLLYSAHAESVRKDQAAVNDLSDALRQSNGVLDENVRKVAYKSLTESGAIATAKQYGISQRDVTSDALGNADAHARVTAAIDKAKAASFGAATTTTQYGASLLGTTKNLDGSTSAFGANAGAQKVTTNASIAAGQKLDGLKNSISGVTGNLKTATQEWKDQAAAVAVAASAGDANAIAQQALASKLGITVVALLAATDGQKKTADTAALATAKMYLENDAAGILKGSLDLLNGKTLNAAQAQNSFDSSLVNMGDHVNATGKKITFTTTSIKDMSSASVALRGQLNSQVTNLQNVVEANGGLANSTGKARAQMVTMRQQIIDNAVAHGVDKAAVTAYIDKLLAIPKKVPPTKLDVDTAAANAKIAATKKLLAMPQWIWTVGIKVMGMAAAVSAVNSLNKRAANGPPGSAAGGLIGRAGGGAITGPGTPTSDSITGVDASGTPIVRVSRDEFVVNAAAYARNKALVNAINDGTQGFAGGGAVGRGGLPTVQVLVERVVQGTPQDIGHEVAWAMAGKGA
jgi:hypothetical protein